jgi:hypothetical protein
MKSILDRSFRYTSSQDTDLAKTFARIRREQRRQARLADGNAGKVITIGAQGRRLETSRVS